MLYNNAPADGSLRISINGAHYDFLIEGSPQIVTVSGLEPTGLPTDVTASFSANANCMRTEPNMYIAPDCGVGQPCDIFGFTVANISDCIGQTQTYRICFDIQGIRLPETLPQDAKVVINGDEIPLNQISYFPTADRQSAMLCANALVGDGRIVDVYIQLDDRCSQFEARLYTAPNCGDPTPGEDPDDECDITLLEAIQSTCEGDGRYSQEIKVYYNDPPSTGQIAYRDQ